MAGVWTFAGMIIGSVLTFMCIVFWLGDDEDDHKR